MALENFRVRQGLEIRMPSGALIRFIELSGATPSASIGNNNDMIVDLSTNDIWKRVTGAYQKSGISQQIQQLLTGIRWRSTVSYYTTDDISSRSGLGPHTLNGQSITFTNGQTIASGNALSRNIYVVGAGSWVLLSPIIEAGDTFFIGVVLSDPVNERGASAFRYTGTDFEKLIDFDFETALSIQLSASFSPPASGSVTIVGASDTLEVSVGKLVTHVENLLAQMGLLRTDANLGSFQGLTIANNTNVKSALQSLVDKSRFEASASNVTTQTVVDSVPVANTNHVEWLVDIFQVSTPANRYSSKIRAYSNGTLCDHNEIFNEQGASITGLTLNVDLTGGNIRLLVTSGVAVNVKSVRRNG
jgi:hypothetical protein